MTDAPVTRTGLADGEWHRLHPASPLLRGGLAFIAVIGIIIANLRERVVEFLLPAFAPDVEDEFGPGAGRWQNEWANDPIDAILSHGWLGWALLGIVVGLLVAVVGFWLSWRMHTFRITDEAVEVRSGLVLRSHRSARLDRIQGVNVSRPLFARLFGTAKLELSVAGQSGDVQLAYLGSALADGLRADILRLSSGVRAARAAQTRGGVAGVGAPGIAEGPGVADASGRADASGQTDAPAQTDASGMPLVAGAPFAGDAAASGEASGVRARTADLVNRRVDEFLAPELDPELAPPESVVHLPILRVIASTLLGGWTLWLIAMIALLTAGILNGWFWVWFSIVPGVIGLVSFAWTQITRSLRYSIAGTPDGVRIGHGLLSTANRTIPPGRVHAIEASQWLMWRPFGWWSVRVNLAGQAAGGNAEAQTRTIVLPVGTVDDVQRVLGLLLPDERPDLEEAILPGLRGRGADGGFRGAPRRAAWVHPFQWRRIGWTERDGVVLVRRGVLLRRLALVPLARLQSVAVMTGPVRRMLRLASVRLHTVAGPITVVLPTVDRDEATSAFEHVATEAVSRAAIDTSHHWGLARRPVAAGLGGGDDRDGSGAFDASTGRAVMGDA